MDLCNPTILWTEKDIAYYRKLENTEKLDKEKITIISLSLLAFLYDSISVYNVTKLKLPRVR